MLIEMHDAVRQLEDGDSESAKYVMDCRCRRSPDLCSVASRQSQNLRQPVSPTYWRDIIKQGDDKMTADCSRRSCESRNSDVSMTSLPESLTSDNDVIDSPTSTGNGFMAARQAEVEMSRPNYTDAKLVPTSGNSGWSRDSTPVPPVPTAGFYISDILRPDFGRIQRGADPEKKAEFPVRRCASSFQLSPMTLLPSTFRRSLVHPYTAAAAFCAAAVAAVQGAASCGSSESAVQRQQLMRHVTNAAATRRLTSSSRDVINNNNNTKLRSRYVSENRNDATRHKTMPARRPHLEQTSPPCSLRTNVTTTTANTALSRPDQSVLASPAASQTSSSRASTGEVLDAKPAGDDGSLVPLPWPAWVYCTRYSDRPSSGRQSKSTYTLGHSLCCTRSTSI